MRELQFLEVVSVVLVGLLGGVLPIPGIALAATLLMCRVSAMSAAQVALSTTVNLLASPLQVVMMPIWGRALASLMGSDTSQFTLSYVKSAMAKGFIPLLTVCWEILLFGVVSWCIAAVIVLLIVHVLQKSVEKKKK